MIVAIALGYLYHLLPSCNGEKKVSGIKDDVKIYYDEFAVPHIFAQNNEDAFTALGYAHAQDRLFQMEYFVH